MLVGRKQRLVIVRAMKIDQLIAEILQDRQSGGRAIDKLTIAAARGKRPLDDEIAFARFNACFDERRI